MKSFKGFKSNSNCITVSGINVLRKEFQRHYVYSEVTALAGSEWKEQPPALVFSFLGKTPVSPVCNSTQEENMERRNGKFSKSGGSAVKRNLMVCSGPGRAVRHADDQKTFTAVDGRSISLRRAYTVVSRVMVPLGQFKSTDPIRVPIYQLYYPRVIGVASPIVYMIFQFCSFFMFDECVTARGLNWFLQPLFKFYCVYNI